MSPTQHFLYPDTDPRHRKAVEEAVNAQESPETLDVERLRRIERAARDVDGLWSESRKLIHWQVEAGEALRDLRDALAAATPSPTPPEGLRTAGHTLTCQLHRELTCYCRPLAASPAPDPEDSLVNDFAAALYGEFGPGDDTDHLTRAELRQWIKEWLAARRAAPSAEPPETET